MNCKEVARFISSENQETASWFKRLAIQFHFSMCKKCRRYATEIKGIGDAARKEVRDEDDAQSVSELEERLIKHIRKD